MEFGYHRVTRRAGTIDEALSDIYEDLPGQKSDADLAARRLAAWCRSSASGDWSLFARRLDRDGLSIAAVLARFATVRPSPTALAPQWIDDALWIGEVLHQPANAIAAQSFAFEHLLVPVVLRADALLWSEVDPAAAQTLNDDARDCLRRSLVSELSNLVAPTIYRRFTEDRAMTHASPGLDYDEFVRNMKTDGFRKMFDEKPVLLRLMASVTRQWIETSTELITRLHTDMPSLRELLAADSTCRVDGIEGGLSDPHNFGRSVRIITFDDGKGVVYKPKDLGVDAAWHGRSNG